MAEYKLISADSHVSEPPDLWIDAGRQEIPRPGAAAGGRSARARRAPISSTRAMRRTRSASGSAPARAPRS